MNCTLSRKASFNAAHRLHNPKWSAEKNQEIFGICNRPNYHGHNYTLIVSVTGEIDPETGYVMDTKILADLIQEHVEERFDHKNLNLDVAEFRDLNPTAENIAVVIWNILRPHIVNSMQLKITLYETERNSVEYGGK
ncbi:MAG TPA: 6-pyruvoyl tetrahydrobiopterin synthase [Flavobacteriales bacterium]|nr:6-pyruvoyl tetrahydrobiopterin synthase [Flavobacteriales bacterium]HCA82302.1 6-pyruvoyl tetrahydrobiopterin synthase [Flavobacteriales bacterium]HRE75352.1 6-carboxytetrahydropterin synthase [Flavobacteriales bacterium]HRE95820.1 6-carboxytetrahydropterin synthase [Flavobacteriales bacterium]HRJ35656.1 6-carboxytetrahydropterin synthase [Flavobacteriales bacterium]